MRDSPEAIDYTVKKLPLLFYICIFFLYIKDGRVLFNECLFKISVVFLMLHLSETVGNNF